MKRLITLSIILLVVFLLSAAGYFLYPQLLAQLDQLENDTSSDPANTSSLGLATAKPTMHAFFNRVPWTGVVSSYGSAPLQSLHDGVVVNIAADDESSVSSGKSLIVIGGPQVEAEQATRQAVIDSLKQQLAVMKQSVSNLRRDLSEQLTTKEKLAASEESELQLDGALQKAILELKSFQSSLVVSAPIDGIFTGRRITLGQTVHAGDLLGEVVNTHRLRIRATLFPRADVSLVHCHAMLQRSGKEVDVGEILHVIPEADPSGAVSVWIEKLSPKVGLRLGQSVGGVIELDRTSVLALPRSAVVYDEKGSAYVFVLEDGGTYQKRSVELGDEQDGWIEIRKGITRSNTVVVTGGYELFFQSFNKQYAIED